MELIDPINSFPKFRILKDISLIKNYKHISFVDIAKQIKIQPTHPYFYEILGYLTDRRLITIEKSYGLTKVISLDIKKIQDLVRETSIFLEVEDFIKKTNAFYSI